MFFTKKDINNLIYLTENAISYITEFHDEAKLIFDKSDIKYEKNITLINVDAHSDVHMNIRHQSLTYANWVNFILLQNDMKSYFWIFPSNMKVNKNNKLIAWDAGPIRLNTKQIKKGNIIKNVYLDKQNFEIVSEEKFLTLKNNCKEFNIRDFYKDIHLDPFIINITKPNFIKSFENDNIFLSIDADFFSIKDNNNLLPKFFRKIKLYNDFSKLLEFIRLNHIQPKYIVMTYSPNYIDIRDKKDIQNFFNLVKYYSISQKL